MSGWIKLHRTILEWEWYDDHNATRLLIHLLVSVNFEDKRWKGHLIKAGSLAFSWDSLSEKVGLSPQQTRTAMKKLEDSNEVNRKSTGKFQLVTLVKWAKLQDNSSELTAKPQQTKQDDNRTLTGNQQDDNSLITPTKESKELEEEENRRKEEEEKARAKKKLSRLYEPLKIHFGISTHDNFNLARELDSFCKVIESTGQEENFIEQFKAYNEYKNKSGEQKHGFRGFLGTAKEQYQDGGWCAENWIHKNQNFKNNGKQTGLHDSEAEEFRAKHLAKLRDGQSN